MRVFQAWRSLLYLPASNARAVEKARGLPADAVILDLEDAVAPEAKVEARSAAAAAVADGWGNRMVGIRVNGFGTDWCAADFAAVAASKAAFVVVPKINGADEAAQAVELGFDGKSCIHPSQLDGVNRAFSPSAEEVAHARGLVEAHRAAMAEGKAVATFKGKMVEVLHVAEAERTLRLAELVGEMGGLAAKAAEIAAD